MKRILAIIIGTLLSGCATVGNIAILDTQKVAGIKPGVTTKAQVKELIGNPTMASFGTEGHETWTYLVTHAKMNPAAMVPIVGMFATRHETESTSVVIMFSDNGVVSKIASTGNPEPKGKPLPEEPPKTF